MESDINELLPGCNKRMQLKPLQPVSDIVRSVFVETLQASSPIDISSLVQ